MRYSIIVPVYNVQEYLGKCLDSLLKQTGDYEILLIDDGSTDGSGAICEAYEKQNPHRIRLIRQENKGLGGARNTGIDNARGEYLLFVDSDDTVSPDLLVELDKTVECFRPEIAVFAMRMVDEEGKPLRDCREALPADRLFSFSAEPDLLLISPNACNKLFAARLFSAEQIRFPDRVWYEDMRTVPKLISACRRLVYVDQPLYLYLQRSGSITNNSNVKRNEEILWAFEDLLGYFEGKGTKQALLPQLERLAIEHIALAATVRVAKVDPKSRLLQTMREFMEQNFPGYQNSPALSSLSRMRRLAFSLSVGGHTRLLGFLFRLKEKK